MVGQTQVVAMTPFGEDRCSDRLNLALTSSGRARAPTNWVLKPGPCPLGILTRNPAAQNRNVNPSEITSLSVLSSS